MKGLINLSLTITRTVGVKHSHITCVHNDQKPAVQREVIFINAFLFSARNMSFFKHTSLFCLSLNIVDTPILVSSKVQINKAHVLDSYTC